MSFKRHSILNDEVDNQLKTELSPLGLSENPKLLGKEIAEKLQFGKSIIVNKKETNPYAKVKPEYVFFYRQKFKLPLRKKPSFAKTTDSKRDGLRKTRYCVRPEDLGIMESKEFVETLNEKLYQDSFYSRRARSFLIVLFWTPLRTSEVFERVISDFEINKDEIIIHLLRKKKGHQIGDPDEDISIPRVLPLVEEVVDWLEGKEWVTEIRNKGKFVRDKNGKVMFNQRPWAISHDTALNYAKELGDGYYPHFFRFNFLTQGANNPEITIAELKTKSRLTLPALEHYIMATKALEQSYNRKILKQLRQEGIIKGERIIKGILENKTLEEITKERF